MHQTNHTPDPAGRPATRPGYRTLRAGFLGTVAFSLLATAIAQAQTADSTTASPNNSSVAAAPPPAAGNSPLQDVIVTGTRQSGQRARDSLTPITIISGAALRATGQVDLRAALEQLSPQISQPGYVPNGGGLKDTISVNGFNPNEVLVLVNGKRRHPSANVTASGGAQQGATGVDLDMIPVSAIDHIEILQAGDSAQYGADAIAGVINIILKSADHGGSFDTTLGQYYAGDGFSRDVAGNVGAPLGQTGFINLSGEYSGHDHTARTYYDSRDDEFDVRDPNEFSTNREDFAFNAGYWLPDDIEIYGFGTYAHRTGSQFEDPRLPSQLPEIYPDGFTPQQTIAEDDWSLTAGIKGHHLLGWSWDLSSTYGYDTDNIGIFESANIGVYEALGYTPTNFHLYQLTSSQWTNNLDFTRPVNVPVLPAPITISFGGEDRHEFYNLGAGDEDSYIDGGSQAAPGLAPQSAGSHSRNVLATYLDLATNLTPKWKIDAAGRFEHYTDVGDTTVGKLSTRYDFNSHFAVRGSYGTGFDAPSLAQEYLTTITVTPTTAGGVPVEDASGLLAANSSAARGIGAAPLKPEQSTNYDFGFVFNPLPNLNFSVDAYQIDIRDRIVTGGTASGEAALNALVDAGFTLTPELEGGVLTASYFTNGANTRSRGLNAQGSYISDFQQYGLVDWTLAANVNDTEITHIANNTEGQPSLNAQQRAWLTTATPKFRVVLGGNWQRDKWGLGLHENLYGPTRNELTYATGPNAFSTTKFIPFTEGFKATTDIAVNYLVGKRLQLTVGANNLFNVYPDKVPLAAQYLGVPYDFSSSQLGYFGGFYYVNAHYLF